MIELSSVLVLGLMLVAVERWDMVGGKEDVGGRAWQWISLAQEPRRTKVFVVGRSSSDLICVPCSRHWRTGNPVKGYDVF